MASETGVSQTGGNVEILHLASDYFCTGVPSTSVQSAKYIRGCPVHWEGVS